MFRSNIRTGYTTTTQTVNGLNTTASSSTFTGIPNTTGGSIVEQSTSDNIIFAIVTGNLREVRRLVNTTNVNEIIDGKNRYTALHYAVKLPNNDIVEYLMNCGADPNIKNNEDKDSIDLSIEANKRFLINKVISGNSRELDQAYAKLDETKYNLRSIEKKNKELLETNTYLEKINGEYSRKIDELKEENKIVKRKLDESEKAFENLLKKNRK